MPPTGDIPSTPSNRPSSSLVSHHLATRSRNRPSRSWKLGPDLVPECDSQRHLGILRLVSSSKLLRISERCSAGRSSFYALNAVGSRFGCLHPTTSLRLYSSFCLPIMLYGCKLWSPTKTELERTHRKILRTITGLPLRCNNKALLLLMGIPNIAAMIQQRQLSFLHSLSTLPTTSLPRLVMSARLSCNPTRGSIPRFINVIQINHLPTLDSILDGDWSKLSWKRFVKKLLLATEYSTFMQECSQLPLSDCDLEKLGKPIPHWLVTRGSPKMSS